MSSSYFEGNISANLVQPLHKSSNRFQHTAARRRLTARRNKAVRQSSFNTQPPEGGWVRLSQFVWGAVLFQHTAARRRLAPLRVFAFQTAYLFQHTAARRRLVRCCCIRAPLRTFQHTAARRRLDYRKHGKAGGIWVSTHSRPKAAGLLITRPLFGFRVSTHSRPKAAGEAPFYSRCEQEFQHTAARRRLEAKREGHRLSYGVSTHSRPKAAGL